MEKNKEEEPKEAPIHGEVLHSILSYVPLIHLLPATRVSKSWNAAVSSSLRHFNSVKPWLVVYTQTTRPPYATTTHAYDPRSGVWVGISQPSIKYISPLRSSHSTVLYMISPSGFCFSVDPLHLTWHHVGPPVVWRTDPIVAVVGRYAVVAGGTCEFEDDPLAVEIYDMRNRSWTTCESMPAVFKDSLTSAWLSVAVDQHKIYVTEKVSGVTYSFDPNSKIWLGPYNLRPDEGIFSGVIGFGNPGLIMVGLEGEAEDLKTVKLWKVNEESMECREIGEMPQVMVEKLKGSGSVSSVSMTAMDDLVFIHNPSEPGEVVMCEVAKGVCQWQSLRNLVVNDETRIMKRMVLNCSKVDIGVLNQALSSPEHKISVIT